MYEIVVKGKDIQFIPIMMPKNVEIFNLEVDEAMRIRAAYSKGQLVVRVDNQEGELLSVDKIWPDPHDPTRMVIFLGPALDHPI